MYSDTVTLFNRAESNGAIIWYATVLTRVDFNADIAKQATTSGENASDNARLHIAYYSQNGNAMIGNKKYLAPKVWATSTEKSASVTFASGKAFDFFMLGAWNGAATVSDSAYSDGFFEYIRSAHDDVYAITNAAMYSVIPHFEITGR